MTILICRGRFAFHTATHFVFAVASVFCLSFAQALEKGFGLADANFWWKSDFVFFSSAKWKKGLSVLRQYWSY